MRSIDYLKKHMEHLREYREGKKVGWRDLAKKTGVSEAYWFKLVKDDDLPPTLERAQQIAEVTDMKKEIFVDLVFRDRLLRYLEKEGLLENTPTENIRKLIELVQKWDPEKDDLRRYIMEP